MSIHYVTLLQTYFETMTRCGCQMIEQLCHGEEKMLILEITVTVAISAIEGYFFL